MSEQGLQQSDKPLALQLRSFFARWPQVYTPSIGCQLDWRQQISQLQSFFQCFADFSAYRQQQRRLGAEMNVWKNVAGRNEGVNSKALCWWLDCHGDHGLGGDLLAALLKHLGLPTTDAVMDSYHSLIEQSYVHEGAVSRVDIKINGQHLLLFIEAKVDAAETGNQLDRYLKIVGERASGRQVAVLYLTRYGELPQRFAEQRSVQPTLLALSWRGLAKILSPQAQALAEGPAKSLLLQFIDHIDSL
ncbi:PD-(D/E)XK nuclease family protein [Neisseriaceae bacterium TC5R-5]|nr:PD-(D/E)XK nuclease family protein [Neisseriaceae bacterium TC5R-5]